MTTMHLLQEVSLYPQARLSGIHRGGDLIPETNTGRRDLTRNFAQRSLFRRERQLQRG